VSVGFIKKKFVAMHGHMNVKDRVVSFTIFVHLVPKSRLCDSAYNSENS